MSNWVAPPPPPERPSRDGCLLAGCVVAIAATLVVCTAFGFGLWWLYRMIEEQRQARLGPPPPLAEMSDEEFQTQVAGGFRQAEVGVDAGTLKSIERFFREAGRFRDNEVSAPEVMRLIDGPRALAEIERSPNCVKLLPADRTSLRQSPFWNNPCRQADSPFDIVHVELNENGREALVWGYFPDPNGDLRPMRWWLARHANGWKVFNWENCGSGRSEAEEVAFMMSLTYRRPQAWEYYMTLATETDEVVERPYLVADGRRRLGALDVNQLDERLFDDGVLRVAYAWYHLRDYGRCLELCDLVKRPQIRPDVERTRTFCLQQLQKWEETLQAADRYERLIGPTPSVLTSRARALLQLSRKDEAEKTWRRVLAVSPGHEAALEGWAELLPEDRKHELVEHLRRVPDAHRLAQQLVERLCAADDGAGARTVAQWLAKEAPNTRESLEAAADLAQFDENFAAAGPLYLAAYTKADSDEERQALLYSYLSAMAAAGRHLEAHAQAPDKRAVLEAFWYDYLDDSVYELNRQTLWAIVAQHKQSEPHDPLVAQIEANLLADEGRDAEAEKILVAALARLKNQPIADREMALKSALVDALLSQGKWKEALEHRAPDYDVAIITDRLLSDGRQADARALVDHLERTMPSESALPLCRAELLRAEKKYAEAWKALPPPPPSAEPNHPLTWRLNHLVSDLVAKDETLLSAFAARAPDNAQWNTLAVELHSQERWATLGQAVETWREAHRSQPEVLYWDAIVKAHAKDHAGVAALLAGPLTDAKVAEALQYRARELHLLLVESLLALGRIDEARRHGQHVHEHDANIEPLLLAAGDVSAIEQAVAGTSRAADPDVRFLPYHQPRFAPLLLGDRFLPLRRSHPPTVEYGYLQDRVVLLLPTEEPPSPETVQQQLAAALPGVGFQPLALAGSSPAVRSLDARRADERWLIHIGSQPYVSQEHIRQLAISQSPVREALKAHRSWIEIGLTDSPVAAPQSLAPALQPPPGSAVYFQSVGRLALWDDMLAGRLAASSAHDDLLDVGQSAYLERDDEPDPLGRRPWRSFVRSFQQRGPDAKPFRVQIELSLGSARERLWFAVTRLDVSEPWNPQLVGTADSDSLLFPTLKAGEPRRIERYRILAVEPTE